MTPIKNQLIRALLIQKNETYKILVQAFPDNRISLNPDSIIKLESKSKYSHLDLVTKKFIRKDLPLCLRGTSLDSIKIMSCVYIELECISSRNLLNAVNTKTLSIIKMNCIIKTLEVINLFQEKDNSGGSLYWLPW